MREPVLNKTDMYRRLRAGEFGNTMQVWTPAEYLESRFRGKVMIRSKVPGGFNFSDLGPIQAVALLMSGRLNLGDCVVQEMIPDENRLLAGELARIETGLTLRYSKAKLPMREAFKVDERYADGLMVNMLLLLYSFHEDKEHLMELLDEYPDHVVEFTLLDTFAGTLYRKMIVWEVRRY